MGTGDAREEDRSGWWAHPPSLVGRAHGGGGAGLGVLPGALSGGSFDPEVAILTLTRIGRIWYTCFTYEATELQRTQEERTRLARRRGLAAGLIAQLTVLESELPFLIEETPDSFAGPQLEHPVFRAALGRLEYLSQETMV